MADILVIGGVSLGKSASAGEAIYSEVGDITFLVSSLPGLSRSIEGGNRAGSADSTVQAEPGAGRDYRLDFRRQIWHTIA
jgi:hypothetical protein